MSSTIGQKFNQSAIKDLLGSGFKETQIGEKSTSKDKSFLDYVKDSINEVDQAQKSSDKMTTNLATGANENIHETMLALSKAELSFNLMVQVRNKALEAYQEVMRMPV